MFEKENKNTIKQHISVRPSTRVLLQGFYGERIKKKVSIISLEEQPFKMTDVTSTIEDKIKYKLKTIKEEKEYSLEIETNQKGEKYTIVIKLDKNKLPKGKFREKIKIYTKNMILSEVVDIIFEGKVI